MHKRKFMTRVFTGLLATTLLPAQAMTLTEAVTKATSHDPTVPYSQALYSAEQELGHQVTGMLRPDVSVSATYANTETDSSSQFFGNFSENYNSDSLALTVRQALYRNNWSARERRGAALDAQAEFRQKHREMRFLLRVTERYFNVLVAQSDLAHAEAEAEAFAKSLADTSKRHEVGLVPGTDLKEAQARNDLAQARLILARQGLASARDALHESTGAENVVLPVLGEDTDLPPLKPAALKPWVNKARNQNLQVLIAREERVIAEAMARDARADLLPRVDAVASYREEDSSDSQVGSQREDTRIALEMTVPIYQGGIQRARSRETLARMHAAQADLDRVLAETERQARQQFRELEAAYAQSRALSLAVKSAAAAEEATRHGYKAGTRTITDVLNARSALINAQRNHARTRYDLLLGRMQLKQLTAELGASDLAEIDKLLQLVEAAPVASQP